MSVSTNLTQNSPRAKVRALVALLLLFYCTSIRAAGEADSIVTIYSKSDSSTSSQGTGFIFSTSGRILTAYHVIQGAVALEVLDRNLNKLSEVKVERIDEKRDLAILSFQSSSTVSRLPLSGSAPNNHSDVRIAGSPRGLPQQVLFGKLSSGSYVPSTSISSAGGKRIFQEAIDVLPIDITVYSGMSGAPVISPDGNVIGVLSGSYDEGRGLAWAIPIKYVDDLNKRPAINMAVDSSTRWPKLTLMSTSWVSLRRSYSQPFDALHLARLESLEGLLRIVRGRWKGTSDFSRDVYSDRKITNYFGTCTLLGAMIHSLDITGIDAEEPRVIGSFSSTTRTKMTVEYGSGGESSREILHRECGMKSGQLPRPIIIESSGSVIATSDVDEDTPTDRRGYSTKINVEDCNFDDGSKCPAKVFGSKKADRMEIISPNRIRWQGSILDRVKQ